MSTITARPGGPGSRQSAVLAVGAANMDISGAAQAATLPGDSTPGQIRCAAGGVARNVAENLARLGCAVQLLSPVGDDLQGRSVLETTRAAGVDVGHCRVLAGRATSTYLSLQGPDGEMQAAVNDMEILECMTAQWLQPHAALVRQAASLVLDCNLPAAALQWLFEHAMDAPVFVDPVSVFKCARLRPWLHRVHMLKANWHEAQALCGHALGDDTEVQRAAAWFHAQGVQQLVLSFGERGMYWSDQDGLCGWQAALPVQVVGATGAGDALLAGLVQQYLQHQPLPRAVRFAAGCAALTLSVPPANCPHLAVAAVEQLLADHGF